MKRSTVVSILATLAILTGVVAGQRRGAPGPAPAGSATARAVTAANAFLGMLNNEERAKAAYAFDSPQKTNWSNLPSGIYQRNSLRLGDLPPEKRAAAMALVASVLSAAGYRKVNDIMNGDETLRGSGGGATGGRAGARGRGGRGGGIVFGSAEYYIAVLGAPSLSTPWMVQFGGHHLAINVTIVGTGNVLTPSLPAAQPARYTLNGQTIRPLGRENDKAFALMATLNADQRRQAILAYRVTDLVLGPGEDGKTIQPEGIPASALTEKQQAMLFDLAKEWVGILNDEGASDRMSEIRANVSRTFFAWSGDTENGGLAYFRIQGPTVLIEYAPQQGDLDHIHTIYRDPTNDYGARLVAP
ncbi:MAG TPA: DUF3500 domain-containing protein [Terriglobia bacterium]|nr:DUF3500 domain-containing protein [Terriglobia bacterium]